MTKKFLCLLLCAALLLGMAVLPAEAADDGLSGLSVSAFSAGQTAIKPWYSEKEKKYYLFLPAGSDPSALTVHIDGQDSLVVNGTAVTDGEITDVFAAETALTVTVGSAAYSLEVLQSENLPAVFIQTESGSLAKIHENKNNKEKGSITVAEDGNITLDNAALKSVKGRGNYTWAGEKKPYNIKFDKKTDMFGMGKAKKWSLLANFFDASLIRNAVALDLAKALGLPFTPEYRFIDLYVNGAYLGNYLICESVEIGEERVDITDLEDANENANPGVDIEARPKAGSGGKVQSADVKGSRKWVDIANDPADITGGYLIESEIPSRYPLEVSGFVSDAGQPIVLKSPEYASRAQVNYIADFYQAAEDAVYAPAGYNGSGKHYSEYFDMDSLVKMYILLEFTMHRDAGLSSCFFYKDSRETKFHAGPAWDFDLSMGNMRYTGNLPYDFSDTGIWWANALGYTQNKRLEISSIFAMLYRHEDFRAAVTQRWSEAEDMIGVYAKSGIAANIDLVAASAVMDGARWAKLTGNSAADKQKNYRAVAAAVMNYAEKRLAALNKGFDEDAAMLYYDSNGGIGTMYHEKILTVGDSAILKGVDHAVTPITPAKDTLTFAGWNTKADGSGRQYAPGDKLIVTGKTNVLYARWQETSAPATSGGMLPPDETDVPTTAAISPVQPQYAAALTSETENVVVLESLKTVLLSPKNTMAALAAACPDNSIKLLDSSGNPPDADALIGTGCRVQTLNQNGAVLAVYDVIVPMDNNGNGTVNSTDARRALRAAARLTDLPELYRKACDLDGNGKIGAADARLILRVAARLETVTVQDFAALLG